VARGHAYKIAKSTSLTLVSISGACSRSGKTAAAVSLLRARPPGSEDRTRPAELVVMEGSTIVTVARPDLQVFVVHPWLSPERSDALLSTPSTSEVRA
jgi:hypothetical protein